MKLNNNNDSTQRFSNHVNSLDQCSSTFTSRETLCSVAHPDLNLVGRVILSITSYGQGASPFVIKIINKK